MSPRLKKAIQTIRDECLPSPLSFEMKDGNTAVLLICGMDVDGHGKFPPSIDFELVILDAMGDEISKKVKTYR